jgi:hypothetical protein
MLDFSVYKPPEEWRMNIEQSWKNGPSWKVSRGRGMWHMSRGGHR